MTIQKFCLSNRPVEWVMRNLHHSVEWAAMTRVLNLRGILHLIHHRFLGSLPNNL
jgi:hypothetical protein